MKYSRILLLLLLIAPRADAQDFQKQVLPVFEAHCVKCHNAEKAMGKLNLSSPDGLKEKATADDHFLIKGDPAKSELYERLILPADDKKRMPKGADPLDQASIDLIANWIKAGATLDQVEPQAQASDESASEPLAKVAVESAGKSLEPLPLPEVALAPQAAIDRLISAGAKVMNLYTDSNLLEVTFLLAPQPPGDDTMKQLVEVGSQVVMLNLKNAKPTDAGWEVLKSLPNLTALNVQGSTFNDAAAKYIEGLERLESLNLYGTEVTDEALKSLQKLPRLQRLYLWKTRVTYDGVTALEKEKPGLEWNLGWDHPEVARRRLESQKADFAELLKSAEAEATRLKTDLQIAEEARKTAEKRLQEVEESLSKFKENVAKDEAGQK